jgi:hypothetical protein
VDRIAGFLSRTRVLAVLFVLLVLNGALFTPAQHGVVPGAPGIDGMPTVTHLQLSWTAERFQGNLAEWSGEPCATVPAADVPCVWPGTTDAGGAVTRTPPPIADGPEEFKRLVVQLDFTFPVIYTLFAIGLASRLWALAGRNRRWLPVVMTAGIVAGVCDVVENSIHLWLLRGLSTWEQVAAADFSTALVFGASVFATIKYGLLLGFIGLAVARLITRLAGRFRGTHPAAV